MLAKENAMFLLSQKKLIAEAVEKIILSLKHPEMPTKRPNFTLYVSGKKSWSFASIAPNWVFDDSVLNGNVPNKPRINPWNEGVAKDTQKPKTVCLCGSTRFSDAFRKANLLETLAGKIVLSIGCDFKSDDALELTIEDKQRLDELHLRKIDLADEVLILNVGGYVGESTNRELAYAKKHNKVIRYWENINKNA